MDGVGRNSELSSTALHKLHDCVFGSLERGHHDMATRIQAPDQSLIEQADKLGYNRLVAMRLLLAGRYWRAAVTRMITIDPTLTPAQADRMQYCSIPGVYTGEYDSRFYTTCRQRSICPFCWYRFLRKRYTRLVDRLPEGDRLALLKFICLPPTGKTAPTDEQVAQLYQFILKRVYQSHCNNWACDTLFALPSRKDRVWRLSFFLVAIVPRGTTLFDPEKRFAHHGQLAKGITWELFEPTPLSLLGLFSRYAQYPAPLLYSDTDPMELAQIRLAFAATRCREHGFINTGGIEKYIEKYAAVPVNDEHLGVIVDTEDVSWDHSLRRPAPEAADVDLPT